MKLRINIQHLLHIICTCYKSQLKKGMSVVCVMFFYLQLVGLS